MRKNYMLTPEDLKLIGREVGGVIEQNVTPALDEIHDRLDQVETSVASLKTQVGYLSSQVVTKDYLDEKIADLRGDINVLLRKEDAKLVSLIEMLQMKKILVAPESKTLLGMEPFAKLMIP